MASDGIEIAWDEYVGEDGDACIHPMFSAGFAAGKHAAWEEAARLRKVLQAIADDACDNTYTRTARNALAPNMLKSAVSEANPLD